MQPAARAKFSGPSCGWAASPSADPSRIWAISTPSSSSAAAGAAKKSYAEIVALAQSLPGPASSQVGFALGLLRAGWLGGLAAWAGFTLPSALLMLAFALGHTRITGKLGLGAVHGLQLVAVAVVAQAILAMRKKLAPDASRMALALLAAAMVYFSGQTVLAIAAGALLGALLPRSCSSVQPPRPHSAELTPALAAGLSRRAGLAAGAVFCALLLLLPIAASFSRAHAAGQAIAVANAFFRSGALVFGGGHVVLPLLERAVVARGWVDQADFLSGYGAAQAIPGPLFTFAAYLGAVIRPTPSPVALRRAGAGGNFSSRTSPHRRPAALLERASPGGAGCRAAWRSECRGGWNSAGGLYSAGVEQRGSLALRSGSGAGRSGAAGALQTSSLGRGRLRRIALARWRRGSKLASSTASVPPCITLCAVAK